MEISEIQAFRRAQGADLTPPAATSEVLERKSDVRSADIEMTPREFGVAAMNSLARDGWPRSGPLINILAGEAGPHFAGAWRLSDMLPAVGGHGWQDERERAGQGEDPWLRTLAASAETSPDVLARLAWDPCAVVRVAVAGNPLSPDETLAGLQHDPSRNVRRMLVENPGIPRSLWEELLERDEFTSDAIACECGRTGGHDDSMRQAFADSGLMLPSGIPADLVARVKEVDEWHWSTQPMPFAILDYMLETVDYLRGPVSDQVSFSHAGHGVNSFSLNLRLAVGPLALLTQTGWGGAYMDNEEQTAMWSEDMQAVSQILDLLKPAAVRGYHQREILIVKSEFRMRADGQEGHLRVEVLDAQGEWEAVPEVGTWTQVIDWMRSPETSGGLGLGVGVDHDPANHLQGFFRATRTSELFALVAWFPSGRMFQRRGGTWVPDEGVDDLDGSAVARLNPLFLPLFDMSEEAGRTLTYKDAEPFKIPFEWEKGE